MAFVEDIINNDREIEEILQSEQECGYDSHTTYNTVAIIIQRYYRGYYTRLYLSKLNSAAKIIQKCWRRYMIIKYNINNNDFKRSLI